MNKKTALLIIDAQVNMFAEDCSVFGGENLLQTIRSLVSKARSAQALIVYVQNNGGPDDPDMPGTPGWQIHPAITPEKGDIMVQKRTPDSFHETNLQDDSLLPISANWSLIGRKIAMLDGRQARQATASPKPTCWLLLTACRPASQRPHGWCPAPPARRFLTGCATLRPMLRSPQTRTCHSTPTREGLASGGSGGRT